LATIFSWVKGEKSPFGIQSRRINLTRGRKYYEKGIKFPRGFGRKDYGEDIGVGDTNIHREYAWG